jgi:hypothetical protein
MAVFATNVKTNASIPDNKTSQIKLEATIDYPVLPGDPCLPQDLFEYIRQASTSKRKDWSLMTLDNLWDDFRVREMTRSLDRLTTLLLEKGWLVPTEASENTPWADLCSRFNGRKRYRLLLD